MPEERESITGVVIPSSVTAGSPEAFAATLDAVALCCTRNLSKGAYFSGTEAEIMLDQYRAAVTGGELRADTERDFLVFTAEKRAKEHNLQRGDEIRRMQKALRWSVADRVPFWAFGAPAGKSESLFKSCPWLRICCGQLACPAVSSGDQGIVHVASINPVAALVCAAAIEREVAAVSGGISPFVFPMVVDLPDWQLLIQRHLPP